MKAYYFIIPVIVLFLSINGYGQENANKLTIPSSPAFSILNFEPAAVMRPTSNKDLAADVLNSFDKDGKLLMNLGLEVTPYWLQSKPSLSRTQYLNPNPQQAFLQSFSLSAATVRDSVSGSNKLGAGFRFKLINGKPVPDLKDADRKLQDIQTIQSDIAIVRALAGSNVITNMKDAMDMLVSTMKKQLYPDTIISNVTAEAGDIARSYKDTEVTQFLDALNNAVDSSKQETLQKVAILTKQRMGFILEFAGATSFSPVSNEPGRIGVWMNGSNYVSATDLFTITTRYMYHNDDSVYNNFDAGLAYMKNGDKYNVSIEYMLRWYRAEIPDINSKGEAIAKIEKSFSYRLAVQGSYLVTDQLSINFSLGKGFDIPKVKASGFFSILGFNYSLFNKERVRL